MVQVRALLEQSNQLGIAHPIRISCPSLRADFPSYIQGYSPYHSYVLLHKFFYLLIGDQSSSTLEPDYNELAQSLSNAIFLARDDRSFERITKAAINKGGCKPEELERVGINNAEGFLILVTGMYMFALVLQVAKW